jgi:hypothetical protein
MTAVWITVGVVFFVLWLWVAGVPVWAWSKVPGPVRSFASKAASSLLATIVLVLIAAAWIVSWLPRGLFGI